jgi:hypothetical protein
VCARKIARHQVDGVWPLLRPGGFAVAAAEQGRGSLQPAQAHRASKSIEKVVSDHAGRLFEYECLHVLWQL